MGGAYVAVLAEDIGDMGGRFTPSLTNLEREAELLGDVEFSSPPDVGAVYPDYLEAMVRLTTPITTTTTQHIHLS